MIEAEKTFFIFRNDLMIYFILRMRFVIFIIRSFHRILLSIITPKNRMESTRSNALHKKVSTYFFSKKIYFLNQQNVKFSGTG